jgi:hypothetical protein
LSNDYFYLYDEKEQTQTRFVSFMGESFRHDLVIITTDRFFGKKLVINIQTNRSAIIGEDDLKEEGYLEFAFNLNEEEAAELKRFLEESVIN